MKLTPYKTAQDSNGLSFMLAETEQEKQKIYDSRFEICKKDFPYILDFDAPYPAKDEFDSYSFLFYVTNKNDVLVASCRITPFFNGEWEISKHLPSDFNLGIDVDKSIQLNRVYVHEDYRNQNLHLFMFYHFSNWVLEHTKISVYFAICNAGLVRFYKKIGARLGVQDAFLLNGRGKHNYYLVTGEISEFNTIIKTKYLNQ